MISEKRKIGDLGEDVACKYLKQNGYKILDRNYLKRVKGPLQGEIDIVAKQKDTISFIEVKAAVGDHLGFAPEQRVNSSKQRKLIKASQFWLMKNKVFLDSKSQIDVIAINLDFDSHKAKIKHFKNAIY